MSSVYYGGIAGEIADSGSITGMSEPTPKPSKPLAGACNASDGFSSCTEPPGHDGPHWDERIQHEFDREDDD